MTDPVHVTASGRHARGIGRPRNTRRRQAKDRAFVVVCVLVAGFSTAILAVLLSAILGAGLKHLDLGFLTELPSRRPEDAGFKVAIAGSVMAMIVCAVFALPIGVGTAVLLEEYRPTKIRWVVKLHDFVQLNITNLAGVPSIVYGILGLTAFAHFFNLLGKGDPRPLIGSDDDLWFVQAPFGRSVMSGGLTLMLVTLPIVITSAREALRAVPDSLREAALAMGATKWQMVARTTLPAAIPGIMTGSILAMSRAIGEAAPILMLSGAIFLTFTPSNFMDSFTVMPLQIYSWVGRPQDAFQDVAASGIIVLLVVLLTFNAIAVAIRQLYQKDLS